MHKIYNKKNYKMQQDISGAYLVEVCAGIHARFNRGANRIIWLKHSVNFPSLVSFDRLSKLRYVSCVYGFLELETFSISIESTVYLRIRTRKQTGIYSRDDEMFRDRLGKGEMALFTVLIPI